jgi:alpha,alpha-trehalose phosphorylase (configuration-retaining)
LYLGIAVVDGGNGTLDVGLASHDGTYSIDFAVHTIGGNPTGEESGAVTPRGGIRSGTQTPSGMKTPLAPEERAGALANYFVEKIRAYQKEHMYKFVSCGINKKVVQLSPQLPSRLWAELDIVPMVFEQGLELPFPIGEQKAMELTVDEEADSMARKSLMWVDMCAYLYVP